MRPWTLDQSCRHDVTHTSVQGGKGQRHCIKCGEQWEVSAGIAQRPERRPSKADDSTPGAGSIFTEGGGQDA